MISFTFVFMLSWHDHQVNVHANIKNLQNNFVGILKYQNTIHAQKTTKTSISPNVKLKNKTIFDETRDYKCDCLQFQSSAWL